MDQEYTDGPVPETARVMWLRVAAISAMVGFSLPTFITGLEVTAAAGPDRALIALTAGSLILTVIAVLMGVIGARTHLSSYLLVRLAFGDRGAAIVNLAFALSLLGWFGVNIDLFSAAVAPLAHDLFGWSLPVWIVEIIAGLLMTATTVYGFSAINRISVLLVPVLALITAVFIAIIYGDGTIDRVFAESWPSAMSTGDAISATVGGLIIGAIILPDITRFCRHWRGAVFTALAAYLVIELVVMAAAGLAGVALEESDVIALLVRIGLGLGAFGIVIAGSWVLNSLNLYSAVLSVQATQSRWSSRPVTLALGAAGILAAFFNLLDAFLTFLIYLAVIFIPVAGVIIMDFFLIRPQRYDHPDFSQPITTNRAAICAWLIAAGYAAADVSFNVPSLSGIVAFDAVGLAALLYAVGHYASRRKTAGAR